MANWLENDMHVATLKEWEEVRGQMVTRETHEPALARRLNKPISDSSASARVSIHTFVVRMMSLRLHIRCLAVKSITSNLDDNLRRRSRVLAAQRKTTVNGLFREHRQSLSNAVERRKQARPENQDMIGRFGGKAGRMPSQEERHARR